MRIVHVIHGLPPERVGGAEVYTRHLAAAQRAAGHDVTVFTPSSPLGATGARAATREQAPDGVTVVRVPLPPERATENAAAQLWHTVRDAQAEAAFASLLDAFAPEVVHFQHLQGFSAELIRIAARKGIGAKVLTLHDYWFFCANSQLRRPGNEPCAGPSPGCRNCVDCLTIRPDLVPLRALRPLTALPLAWRNRYLADRLREVDHCIAPSAFLRDRYLEQGLEAERVIVLENGIQWRAGEGAPLAVKGAPRFAYVGTLAPHKGVHLLIEAFNRLPLTATLLIMGDGGDTAFVEQLRQLARHPGIHFAGQQEQPVVHATLPHMDCLVAPSLWFENSPLVVQEAFAAGLPVVASRLGALQEKVRDGVDGRLFTAGSIDDLAALLADLVSNPQLLPALKAGVRAPLTMEAHAARLDEIYAQVRKQSPGGLDHRHRA